MIPESIRVALEKAAQYVRENYLRVPPGSTLNRAFGEGDRYVVVAMKFPSEPRGRFEVSADGWQLRWTASGRISRWA